MSELPETRNRRPLKADYLSRNPIGVCSDKACKQSIVEGDNVIILIRANQFDSETTRPIMEGDDRAKILFHMECAEKWAGDLWGDKSFETFKTAWNQAIQQSYIEDALRQFSADTGRNANRSTVEDFLTWLKKTVKPMGQTPVIRL